MWEMGGLGKVGKADAGLLQALGCSAGGPACLLPLPLSRLRAEKAALLRLFAILPSPPGSTHASHHAPHLLLAPCGPLPQPTLLAGHAGYTSYAPSKWALRGLADSLRNELAGTGVEVSVAYPPDTGRWGRGRAGRARHAVSTAWALGIAGTAGQGSCA